MVSTETSLLWFMQSKLFCFCVFWEWAMICLRLRAFTITTTITLFIYLLTNTYFLTYLLIIALNKV